MRRYLFLLLLATACVPLGTPITDPNAARSPGQQRPPSITPTKPCVIKTSSITPM
ncbi:hypothetical protein [Hymenobacter radiodurans]|uniref:hypothetical protein n=1 Tax=Hymenobacter radiodurans TaxID=2496028 RepID=UPI001404290E|nr:hypothetical protein [Hymenobacter radiodurans]